MGYHRHHAIVVTSWSYEYIKQAHSEAGRAFAETPCAVSEITGPAINGYRSFFISPDGSKEGWSDSDQADAAREQFVAWLRSSGNYSDWVEVNFGGDDADMVGVRGPYGGLRGRADDDTLRARQGGEMRHDA